MVLRKNRGMRLAVSVALMSAATAILWYMRSAGVGSHHVYLYLLPVILIRILCGIRVATFSVLTAIVLANYFLQAPIYSLYNDNPLEYGDLLCFAILAVTAIKSMPSRKERGAFELPVPGAEIPVHRREAGGNARGSDRRVNQPLPVLLLHDMEDILLAMA